MGLPVTLPGPAAAADAPATPILTQQAGITFATRQVAPPSEVYVTQDDSLHVVTYCSQTNVQVTIAFRILRKDGVVIRTPQVIVPRNDRVRRDDFFPLTEGFLLSVDVSTSTPSILRGQCWVDIDISQGSSSQAVDYQSILSDYLTTGASIGFPGARQISSVEGPGVPVNALFTLVPATGATVAVPSGARWLLRQIAFEYVAGGAVATRVPIITIVTSSDNTVQAAPVAGQTSGTTVLYTAGSWGSVSTAFASAMPIPLPDNILLLAGDSMNIVVNNQQAGDTAPVPGVVRVEEWLEPAA